MAEEVSFEIKSGYDATLKVAVTDTDTQALMNLTGSTDIRWGLSKSAAKPPLFEYDLEDGITIADAANGAIEVAIDREDTEPLKAGIYYHEMALYTSAGKKVPLMYGEVTVTDNTIKEA